jgi:hypothetical protein
MPVACPGRADRERIGDGLLLRAVPGTPILSASGAAELIGRSFPQANETIGRLVSAGVLTQISVGNGTGPSRPGTSSTPSPTLNASSPARTTTPAAPNRAGQCHPIDRPYFRLRIGPMAHTVICDANTR